MRLARAFCVPLLCLAPCALCAEPVAVGFSKAAFYPLLRSKFGIAATLGSADRVSDFENALPHLLELDPAICNLPLLFSSLREPLPADPRSSKVPFLNPYPIYRDASGAIQIGEANPRLLSLHRELQGHGILVLHQLMGAPYPWYNNDPALARLTDNTRPRRDDRFPVPTDVAAAADAMGRWRRSYESRFPMYWGIWQEAGHYLRNGRPDIGAPQYADIVYNYVQRIRAHAGADRDRQLFGLQLLAGDAKASDVLERGGHAYPANSFLGYLLASLEKRLRNGETLSDIVDTFNLNDYATMAGGKPTVFNTELASVRSIIGRRLPGAPFVYTQIDVGDRPAARNDRRAVVEYHNSLQAAVDALEIMANINETPDVEHACWDFILDSVKAPAGGPAQFTPLYQAFRLARSMPVRRYSAQAPEGVRAYACASERARGDAGDSAAVLLWARAGSGALDLTVTLRRLPAALVANGRATVHVYRIDAAHYGKTGGELARAVETRTVACDNDEARVPLQLARPGIALVRVGADVPAQPLSRFQASTFCRKYSFADRAPERPNGVSGSYGFFDAKYARAYLGVKTPDGRAICGAMYCDLPDSIRVALATSGLKDTSSPQAILGVRVDYFDASGAPVKSVLWPGPVYSSRHSNPLPWGKGGVADEIAPGGDAFARGFAELDLRAFAPTGWSKKAVISFWMEGTGEEALAEFTLG